MTESAASAIPEDPDPPPIPGPAPMKRRLLLDSALAALTGSLAPLSPCPGRESADGAAEAAVAAAHAEIWRRFVDPQGILIDFAGPDGAVSLPTPEECRLGKPNALGWWSPIENGAMFNGMYLEAMTLRWGITGEPAIAERARRLMEGLLLLNDISEVPGFVGRGVSTDGRSHYPMGSNDQTFPWFYGLWRYLESGLATEAERDRIVRQLARTAGEIVSRGWMMPAEAPFGVRGGFGGPSFESAPRLLFVCRMMHRVTGEAVWEERYRDAAATRLEVCEQGMVFGAHPHSWTAVNSVCALRGLWELETDEPRRGRYAEGLRRSAETALASLPLAERWDNGDRSPFAYDWRVMNDRWRPQQTEQEAQQLAEAQLRDFLRVSPRRNLETQLVREPTFAAWIVTLAPDRGLLARRAGAVRRVATRYDYARLVYSQFFPVECAWWRLRSAGL